MEKTVRLKITGMHCPDCPTKIERTLVKIGGVSKVEVNYKNESGIITYNPNEADVTQFANKIKKMGFDVKEQIELAQ